MNPGQLALYRMTLDMTDINTEGMRSRNDVDWLTERLPAIIADLESRAAAMGQTFPDEEAAFGSQFQVAMMKFQSFNWRRFVAAPSDLEYDERKAWEKRVRAELRPDGLAQLAEAKQLFGHIAQLDSPAAELSTYPRTARMMLQTVAQVEAQLAEELALEAEREAEAEARAAEAEARDEARAAKAEARARAKDGRRREGRRSGPRRSRGDVTGCNRGESAR